MFSCRTHGFCPSCHAKRLSPPCPSLDYRVNANTNLLIKVEIMINKDELSLFYPKVLKGLRKLWQERDVK